MKFDDNMNMPLFDTLLIIGSVFLILWFTITILAHFCINTKPPKDQPYVLHSTHYPTTWK